MRRWALLGLVVTLLAGLTGVASSAPPEHRLRYWHIGRVDAKAYPIEATVDTTLRSYEAVSYLWVTHHDGRHRTVFDSAVVFGHAFWPAAGVGDVRTPPCPERAVCTSDRVASSDISVKIPVRFDYFLATRDADVEITLSPASRKHWRVKELTGRPEVRGTLRLAMAGDGDTTSVEAGSLAVQHLRSISASGGRHGSLSLAAMPMSHTGERTSTGVAELTGGHAYGYGGNRLDGTHEIVVGSARQVTTWRLAGDLVAAGARQGPVLAVYDLPEPKALARFMRS